MKQLCLLFLAILIFSCKETSTEPIVPMENQTSTDPNIGCTDQMATNYKSTAKKDDCSCKYDFNSTLSNDIPADFTQKILIEEHSGTWCGWCPLSKETLERLAINPNIVGVEIHYNDKLTLLDEIYVPLKNIYGHPAWPSGMINRKKNINGSTFIIGEPDWEKNTTAILSNPKTDIGIALDTKIVGDEVVILTKTKFNKAGASEKYGIGIYLVEDKVEKYPQINYARGMPQFIKYKAYTLPALIEDIKHYNVARGVIAPHVGGHAIPEAASKKLTVYNKLFKYKITNKEINLANCKIIAFVMNEKNEIENVNYCPLGNKANWN
jgi:hypothetical protein